MWCPVDPRNEAAENRELLELFGCGTLIFQAAFAPLVEQIRSELPQLTTLGERVTVVVQPRSGQQVDPAELTAFVKQRIGSVKAPKQVEVWPDLPRSKVGKVLKTEIKQVLLTGPG